jgi:uncharacterized protein (DUF2252 family)
MPGIGEHGEACERALAYVVKNAKPSGLLNIAAAQRDTYNHGLATFVLGQAYGMTADARIGKARACGDGGRRKFVGVVRMHGKPHGLRLLQGRDKLAAKATVAYALPEETVK